MATRTLHLITSRNSPMQRAHFTIFVTSNANPNVGTLIQVVGLPMAGYQLEFKRNYSPLEEVMKYEMCPIGEVSEQAIVDSENDTASVDDAPRDQLEREAAQLPPPRISKNFRAPVNNVKKPTTNRRCQEWTTDFVQRLIDKNIISQEALGIVQGKRDPPSHGII